MRSESVTKRSTVNRWDEPMCPTRCGTHVYETSVALRTAPRPRNFYDAAPTLVPLRLL
jgi:hypothetical protein